MHATYLNQYGPPDVLQYGELAEPRPAPGEVLIRVHAAGVNPIDWRFRSGSLRYLVPGRFPLILGYDVSGVVTEVSGEVGQLKIGDEVYSMLDHRHGGGYAEMAVASARVVAPKPANLTHEQAAAVPLAAITALQSLRDLGRIAAGQRVLINGASGGVGTFAVQVAKIFDTEVTGVCSADNAQLVQELGADHVIDYHAQDFTQAEHAYDIVFDAVAKSSFLACRKILNSGGSFVGTLPSAGQILFGGLTRFWRGKRCRTILAQPSGDDLRFLTVQIEAGRLRPVIDQVLPLREASRAHQLSEAGHARGKLVLRVEG